MTLTDLEADDSTFSVFSSYPNNNVWVIRTEDNRRILVSLMIFDSEASFDFPQAREGEDFTNSSATILWWNERACPPHVLSVGNAMWLKFGENDINPSSGFSLSAQSVPSGKYTHCYECQKTKTRQNISWQ